MTIFLIMSNIGRYTNNYLLYPATFGNNWRPTVCQILCKGFHKFISFDLLNNPKMGIANPILWKSKYILVAKFNNYE